MRARPTVCAQIAPNKLEGFSERYPLLRRFNSKKSGRAGARNEEIIKPGRIHVGAIRPPGVKIGRAVKEHLSSDRSENAQGGCAAVRISRNKARRFANPGFARVVDRGDFL